MGLRRRHRRNPSAVDAFQVAPGTEARDVVVRVVAAGRAKSEVMRRHVAAGADGSHALQPGKIAPWVNDHTANGQQAEFFVVLADQADLSGAASLPTKAEKGRFVYETLRSKAQSTQEPILQWLRDRGLRPPSRRGVRRRPLRHRRDEGPRPDLEGRAVQRREGLDRRAGTGLSENRGDAPRAIGLRTRRASPGYPAGPAPRATWKRPGGPPGRSGACEQERPD